MAIEKRKELPDEGGWRFSGSSDASPHFNENSVCSDYVTKTRSEGMERRRAQTATGASDGRKKRELGSCWLWHGNHQSIINNK